MMMVSWYELMPFLDFFLGFFIFPFPLPFPLPFSDFDELGLRLGLRLGRGVPFRNLTCLCALALVAEAPLNGFFVKDRCRDLDVDDGRLEPEDDAPDDLTDLDGFRPLCVVLSLLFCSSNSLINSGWSFNK